MVELVVLVLVRQEVLQEVLLAGNEDVLVLALYAPHALCALNGHVLLLEQGEVAVQQTEVELVELERVETGVGEELR